jgi:hypothetical protein
MDYIDVIARLSLLGTHNGFSVHAICYLSITDAIDAMVHNDL